jgi:hypothetical protein
MPIMTLYILFLGNTILDRTSEQEIRIMASDPCQEKWEDFRNALDEFVLASRAWQDARTMRGVITPSRLKEINAAEARYKHANGEFIKKQNGWDQCIKETGNNPGLS